MRTRTLLLSAFFVGIPAAAMAQAEDVYVETAPGDPIESVDVFYDELEPYGIWVDEPEVGRVFIPDEDNYVPYREGHWEDTDVGFVWVEDRPYTWATVHYGRWAFSEHYRRWYWAPDTHWGPAWVEWRQTGDDFGWAPLAPEVVVRRGWQPPVDNWHYCPAEHVLDVHVTRYYEPRERVVVIHREARPIEHYATISRVKVVVGPPRTVLVQHHVTVKPVRVEARTVGRWSAAEVHEKTVRAQEHRPTFEAQNQRRIESHPQIRAAHAKVIEEHPQIKAQVTERMQAAGHTPPPAPKPVEPQRTRPEPQPQHRAPVAPPKPEPARAEPQQPPAHHVEPPPPQHHAEPPPPHRSPEPPPKPEPARAEPPPPHRAAPPPREKPAPQHEEKEKHEEHKPPEPH